LNELVALCHFPLSANSRKPTAAKNHKIGFQWENVGKLSAVDVNGISAITSLQQAPYEHG
jgi:hypothetical protein